MDYEEKLDYTDIQILSELQKNAKLTIKELASAVNLSSSPTFERLKRLEKEGYIKKYVAVLDARKVGNGIIVLCNVSLKEHSKQYIEGFMAAVESIDEVVECYNTSGDFDFLMKLYVKDMQHYRKIVIDTLGVIESVGSLHSIFVINEVKKSDSIPIFAQ